MQIIFFPFVLGGLVQAQKNITIQGKVIDENSGETIVGANVVVSGAKAGTGTATDPDGWFELKTDSLPGCCGIRHLIFPVE
ncbi:MAG: carboxypeptidase-like regulatory domain-containing protein [Tannerella sp.]|nr:carboxypeptidase-like regulatory domain-containing protein [Tannerella sp.]